MKKLREEFADLMLEIGSKNKNLVVMVGDISHGILQPFAKKFPNRYYNIGICEPSMVNVAAGIKKIGLIPVVHTIAPFITERAFEQIKLDLGYQNLGANIVSIGSAFDYAKLGCSHHCYTDISLLSHLKNSQVFMPGSAIEFKELFKQAYKQNKINYFKLTDNAHEFKFTKDQIKIGKGIVVCPGRDLTISVVGSQLKNVLKVRKKLSEKMISAEILYFPTLKPFDNKVIKKSVEKTRRLVCVEELSAHDGLFNQCIKSLAGKEFKYKQIAIKDFIKDYGAYEDLCNIIGLSVKNIYKQSMILMNK